MLLSFVIPCYRSERTIKKVVDEIIATVSMRSSYDYEIIAINDCSPDHVESGKTFCCPGWLCRSKRTVYCESG